MCRTQADVDASFGLFLGNMRSGGVLIACGDDPGCKRVVGRAAVEQGMVTWMEFCHMAPAEKRKAIVILFYGYAHGNDVTLHVPSGSMDDVQQQAASSDCSDCNWNESTRMVWAMPEIRDERAFAGHFAYRLHLIGHHNALNAAGAVLAAAITNTMFRTSFSSPAEALSKGAELHFGRSAQLSSACMLRQPRMFRHGDITIGMCRHGDCGENSHGMLRPGAAVHWHLPSASQAEHY